MKIINLNQFLFYYLGNFYFENKTVFNKVFLSFFLVSITIIIFIGTIKFHFKTDEPDMMSLPIFKQIILSFALQTNLKSIFTVPKSKNDSIQVFHGIKFFAMCSIISFHSFALSSFNIDFSKYFIALH